MANPTPLFSKPGIKRDGTRFDNDYHVDGQWVRWHRGRARKMGGYQRFSEGVNGIVRGLHGYSRGGTFYLHGGSSDKIEQFQVTGDNNIGPAINRTGASFVTNADNLWSFGQSYDAITTDTRLLVHAAPNASNIDSTVKGQIYYGLLTDVTAFTKVQIGVSPADFQVAGSVWQIGPYAFAGDNDGRLYWSVPNHPSDFTTTAQGAGQAQPTNAKFLTGKRIRGAGAYAGLAWTLDTLVRMSFAGGTTVWSFDEISTTYLLGPQAVIEADGMLFWPDASQRFMTYNGMPQEVPNAMNKEFFFDNLNWACRGKVHGYYNARWGELVWHAPLFGATECNWAIIYNLRENAWYDTPLPNGGRSAALAASIYRWPVLAGIAPIAAGLSPQYRLWRHEIGTDEVDGNKTYAVRSYVTTGDLSLMKNPQQPSTAAVSVEMIEPDIDQTGDMTLTVYGNKNARSPTFTADEVRTVTADQSGIPMKEEFRQMRFRWESNTLGGNYEMGQTMAHISPSQSGVLD
jgi:hypothetical protein